MEFIQIQIKYKLKPTFVLLFDKSIFEMEEMYTYILKSPTSNHILIYNSKTNAIARNTHKKQPIRNTNFV